MTGAALHFQSSYQKWMSEVCASSCEEMLRECYQSIGSGGGIFKQSGADSSSALRMRQMTMRTERLSDRGGQCADSWERLFLPQSEKAISAFGLFTGA